MTTHSSLYPVNTIEALRSGTVYMRTSSLFRVSSQIVFEDGTPIRHFTSSDAAELHEVLRKRDVFSRHRYDRDFYTGRALAFADKVVVEVVRIGTPDHVRDDVARTTDVAEQVTLLAAGLVLPRQKMLSELGIRERASTTIELLRGPQLKVLRSKTSAVPTGGGVRVDASLAKRVKAAGLDTVFTVCCGPGALSKRLATSVRWLSESRCEPRLDAAIVKSAIAMESLLIFSESESLARSLSERMAFLLSDDGSERKGIARTIKRFYGARSGVVHGGKKKRTAIVPQLLEAVDRLLVLSLSVIAAGAARWPSEDELGEWCEAERWGAPQELIRPFQKKYLRSAMALCGKALT